VDDARRRKRVPLLDPFKDFPRNPTKRSFDNSIYQMHRWRRLPSCASGGRLKPDTIRNILIREVIRPLEKQFPTPEGEKGFRDGRLHSFRHAFCSICANSNTPERMVMEWLGHSDSAMVRWYYHMHDDESRQRMAGIDFLGGAKGNETGTR
jgi:integrase